MELTVLLGEGVRAFLRLVTRKDAVLAPFATSNVDTTTLNKVSCKPHARSIVVERADAEALYPTARADGRMLLRRRCEESR